METLDLSKLKQIAKTKGLKNYSKLTKSELIQLLKPLDNGIYDKFNILRNDTPSKYTRMSQLGQKGKEGTVYFVLNSDGHPYAMKTFRKAKSGTTLEKEAYFQYLASLHGLSPKVIEYNTVDKYIVMELMERTLRDIINVQKTITPEQQRQILNLYKELDKIGIMANDANPLNIMERKGKLYIIDFGLAKFCDHSDFTKHKCPNYELMPIGLLIWLKKIMANVSSLNVIKSVIPKDTLISLNIQ